LHQTHNSFYDCPLLTPALCALQDNRNAIRNHVEGALKRTQAFLAAEARDVVDARVERKSKQEAIEQQVEKLSQRLSASHRAKIQSGVLPTNDNFAADVHARADLHEGGLNHDDATSSSGKEQHAPFAAAEQPLLSGSGLRSVSMHANLSSADDALWGDALDVRGISMHSSSRTSPNRAYPGASGSTGVSHDAQGVKPSGSISGISRRFDGMPAPQVVQPRTPESGHPHRPSSARSADASAKTPASDRACGASARVHSSSASPVSRVAPLAISGGVNRLPANRLSFDANDRPVDKRPPSGARQPSAGTVGRSSNLAKRPTNAYHEDDDLLPDTESEDLDKAPSWLDRPGAASAAASSRAGSSFASRRRKR
jgi:hypothetical protein